jgi:tetraacyldisaccharide 4'-kinase
LNILGAVYGRGATWRRGWYDRHPQRRRLLARPVISVGNLVVGGSGKTPTVAAIARLLLDMGERPAILSRGYARRDAGPGVLVVSDGARVLVSAARSGDEPQMLARALGGVPVVVARHRHQAGCLAERDLGATVHLLDDGFQHVQLARDVDLAIVSAGDLHEPLLPGGRLREPVTAARHADAVLVPGGDDARVVAAAFPGMTVFSLMVRYHPLRALRIDEGVAEPASRLRVVAVAGVARPERFFTALRAQGIEVAREIAFRDHHWFSAGDVATIVSAARDLGVGTIATTEKDAVRLLECGVSLDGAPDGAGGRAPRCVVLPMTVAIEPADEFTRWLADRLRVARERRGDAA